MKEEYLLVDGYNIIYAWPKLRELAKINLDAARLKLQDILSNYQGYKKNHIIVVYDAYKVKGNPGSTMQFQNIHIVFTKEAETADQYIEKVVGELVKEKKVRVATSDYLEQIVIMGRGAARLPAQEFAVEIEEVNRSIRQDHLNKPEGKRNFLINNLPPEMAEVMEKMRLTETDE